MAREFSHVVIDGDERTSVDFQLATHKPPNILAYTMVNDFANKPPGRRDVMFAKILSLAKNTRPEPERGPEPEPEPEPEPISPGDAYLDSRGEGE